MTFARLSVLWALVLAVAGCATGPTADPRDPLEPFNRSVYEFNESLDSALVKPVAQGYHAVLPSPVRQGVSNFFGNLGDLWSGVSGVLQGEGGAALDSFARFGINSTVGLLGLFDVAGAMDIERHSLDFGQTLGRWGLPTGPYLVLPLLGPTTVRDTVALPVDWKGDVVTHVSDIPARNQATALRLVDKRASLLQASSLLEEAALDRYTFVRDVVLQRRGGVKDTGDDGGDDAASAPAPVTKPTTP